MTASPSYIMELKKKKKKRKKKNRLHPVAFLDGKMVLELVMPFIFLYRITHWIVKDHVTT